MRRLILASVALAISACSSTSVPQTDIIELPIYHPVRPEPYKTCSVYWNYLEVDGSAMKAITFDDGIELEKCMRDKNRYMEQLNQVLCQYRQELSEPMCLKDKNDGTKNQNISTS